MRRVLLAVLVAGCGGGRIEVPPVEPPAMRLVSGAPLDARAATTVVGTRAGAQALLLLDGGVAVADAAGVAVRRGTRFDVVPVGAPSESTVLGAVRFTARRNGGALLVAGGGFFHDASGRLLRAPVSESLAMDGVRFVDVAGSGAAETWWLTTSDGAERISSGQLEAVDVDDARERGAVQAVVGSSGDAAVLVRGGSVYRVDVAARVAHTLARGLGTVSGFDRLADGTVLLGTGAGLVRVSGDSVSRLTLAAEGADARAVADVVSAGDVALVVAGGQLLELRGDSARTLADVAVPHLRGTVRDAAGTTFFLDGEQLVSLAPAATVSFAADVRPFFDAHCTSCHATGAQYSPVIDLASLATARAWAPRVVARLTNTASPMPPASSGVLTAAQYGVVLRWVDGGMQP